MLIYQGSFPRPNRQTGAPFLDAKFKRNEFMLLGILLYTRAKVSRVPMQPKQVSRVHGIFHRLQPITIDDRVLDDPTLAVFPDEHIPSRQQRLRLRAEVSENQSTQYLHWIGAMFDPV